MHVKQSVPAIVQVEQSVLATMLLLPRKKLSPLYSLLLHQPGQACPAWRQSSLIGKPPVRRPSREELDERRADPVIEEAIKVVSSQV